MISADQIRAEGALPRSDQRQLAGRAPVSPATLRRAEAGAGKKAKAPAPAIAFEPARAGDDRRGTHRQWRSLLPNDFAKTDVTAVSP